MLRNRRKNKFWTNMLGLAKKEGKQSSEPLKLRGLHDLVGNPAYPSKQDRVLERSSAKDLGAMPTDFPYR